jgi:hypothetical protein
MSDPITRRDFLKTAPAAACLAASVAGLAPLASAEPVAPARLEPFDFDGVRLLDSRWRAQYQAARDFYLGIPDDDILHGFRRAAGLPAPGAPLGGWCSQTTGGVFGQWLSGMARVYRATGDGAMRDKAVRLFTEWAKTVKADGDCGMRHYPYDKLVCGLVDLQMYAGQQDAIVALEKVTGFAIKNFNRDNVLADPAQNRGYYGRPQEWYTLSENLYRAYRLTGNPMFKTFGDVWLYEAYWNKFAASAAPPDAHGVHAYSHVNTFSGAAMAYGVTGDASYLRIAKNAYDYLQDTQCYATGGYGPNERFMAPDGALGRALDSRTDTFETACGSWAGFKLSRYLMQFTGEARYGDWAERLLYNGIGAALPIAAGGKNFYYSDYRVGSGMKVYNWDTWTCCSGTYLQDVVDYHNLIYFHDASDLYVNLYVPSTLTWNRPGGRVVITQETSYPEEKTSTIRIDSAPAGPFTLRFRVPSWASGSSIAVNGADTPTRCAAGTWAALTRTWTSGDRVDVRIPLRWRMPAVDRQHPERVAVVRGPVVFVLEAAYHDPFFRLPERDEDLETWLVPDVAGQPTGMLTPAVPGRLASSAVFRLVPPDKSAVRLKFRPFYDVPEAYPYAMYYDRRTLPYRLW